MERVLLIDDMRNIKADRVCRTFDEGLKALRDDGPWDVLLLDHDLGDKNPRKTGYDLLVFLEEYPRYLPKQIRLVTQNPVGVEKMTKLIDALYGRT